MAGIIDQAISSEKDNYAHLPYIEAMREQTRATRIT